jgi:hypothetical protein
MRRKARRGRPPQPRDTDLAVAELAIAVQAAWDLSERKAIDWALAVIEGEPVSPSKIPRGMTRRQGTLIGHALPRGDSFAGRSRDIRRKLNAGRLRPDAGQVLLHARVLHRLRRGGT